MNKLSALEWLAKIVLGYFLTYTFFDLSDAVSGLAGFLMIGLSIWGLIAKK